jgi:hypothetical protein
MDKTDKVRYSINGGPLKMTAEVDEATAAVLKVIADYHLEFITKYKVIDDTLVELELVVADAMGLAKANKNAKN